MNNKTLVVTVRSDDFGTDKTTELRTKLKDQLPNHDIAIIVVGREDGIDFQEFKNGSLS